MKFCHSVRTVIVVGVLLLGMAHGEGRAATFAKADVTALLGRSFFVDDAVIGGTDATVNQPASGTYVRSFAGLLTVNQGSTTGACAYLSNGEYGCVFDTPLVATLNITAVKFQISIAPSNEGGNGSVIFEVGTISFDSITGPKLSVAGSVSGALPPKARRLNVAKFQNVVTNSENGNHIADYAADGAAGNENSWRSATTAGPHWAEVTLPVTITVRSARLFLGIDERSVPASFKLQYYTGSTWANAPGSLVTGNPASGVNSIFSGGVTASRFRFHTDGSNTQRVKEFALFRTNPAPGTGTELGYPIGTDVELNVAKNVPRRPARRAA